MTIRVRDALGRASLRAGGPAVPQRGGVRGPDAAAGSDRTPGSWGRLGTILENEGTIVTIILKDSVGLSHLRGVNFWHSMGRRGLDLEHFCSCWAHRAKM